MPAVELRKQGPPTLSLSFLFLLLRPLQVGKPAWAPVLQTESGRGLWVFQTLGFSLSPRQG